MHMVDGNTAADMHLEKQVAMLLLLMDAAMFNASGQTKQDLMNSFYSWPTNPPTPC